MRCFVTGGAGFIGSNLVDRLLAEGHEVCAYDALTTGQERFLQKASSLAAFRFVPDDLLDMQALTRAMQDSDIVFHLAANADVRHGLQHPRRDLEQNTLATFNVLEAMRTNGVRKIAFSSTGSIYGEAIVVPTPEDAPFPVQTSLYGAPKLACEGLIEAYCEGYDFQAWIFRFVSILGERYSHGHVFDFYRQLRQHPCRLRILGNGKQSKSYLYVQDCIDAILVALEKAEQSVNIFNLGTDECCTVDDSVGWITQELGLEPEREYTGGQRGWIGDNPLIVLDCERMRALGWKPRLSIQDGIKRTVKYLQDNTWLLQARAGSA